MLIHIWICVKFNVFTPSCKFYIKNKVFFYLSGCRHLGVTYTAGEMFPKGDDCNTCKCLRTGDVQCTEKKCHPGKLIAVNTLLQWRVLHMDGLFLTFRFTLSATQHIYNYVDKLLFYKCKFIININWNNLKVSSIVV